jgi:hypothetical protein
MAGGTHAFDMIKRLKENQNLKTLHYFKKQKHLVAKSKEPLLLDTNSWREENSSQGSNEIISPIKLLRVVYKVIAAIALLVVVIYLSIKLLS